MAASNTAVTATARVVASNNFTVTGEPAQVDYASGYQHEVAFTASTAAVFKHIHAFAVFLVLCARLGRRRTPSVGVGFAVFTLPVGGLRQVVATLALATDLQIEHVGP